MVRVVTRKGLGAICLFVLCGTLVAGLWPFHAPRNHVAWLNPPDGLSFAKYGSIVSAGVINAKLPGSDGSCSLVMSLKPRQIEGTGMILAFYRDGLVPFAIRQYHHGLVLERTPPSRSQGAKKASLAVYVDKVFNPQRPVMVTITSNRTGTTVYADGTLLRESADFGLPADDLTGQLVIGNSAVTTHPWSGEFRSLGIYYRQLTADDISQHPMDWTTSERPEVARDGAVALYLFNEGKGNVVHNQVDSATDLLIPERFFILHEQFLERPWDEYRPGWHYWKDIAINIVGFIPLGFFFCAYFSSATKSHGVIARTIVLGFLVSLTIEVLQSFLPTRDSGMTDLITNTLGAAFGVISFRLNVFPQMSSAARDSSHSSIVTNNPCQSLKMVDLSMHAAKGGRHNLSK
jgi:VanZ family protein